MDLRVDRTIYLQKKTMEHFKLINKLHTDILEEKYWPIHAKIHIHNDTHRIVDLCDEQDISRTRAITIFFKDSRNEEIKRIDEIIKAWSAIGKTFREFGYEVRKNVISVYVIQLSEELKKVFDTQDNTAKIRLSEFYAKSPASEPIIYWIVAEIYSPDFRSGAVNQVDFSQINPLTRLVEQYWGTKQDLRDILGRENDWSHTTLPRHKITNESQYDIISYQTLIHKYL
jgi:hypothetical protein